MFPLGIEQRTDEDPSAIGLHADDEIARLRQDAGIAGRDEEVLAALALIRSARSDVLDRPHPHIVDETEHAGRRLDDRRSVGVEGEECRAVQGLRIGRQHERVGVRPEDGELGNAVHAEIARQTKAKSVHAERRQVPQEDLCATLEVEFVIKTLHRLGRRVAVLEGKPTEKARVHIGRRRSRGGDGRDRHRAVQRRR